MAEIDDAELEALRAQAANAEANASAQRELAFVKAGIDTSSKLGSMFVRTYEGELTADAIKAEATGLPAEVFVAAPATADTVAEAAAAAAAAAAAVSTATDAEKGATTDRQTMATGAVSNDGSGVNVRSEAMDEAKGVARTDSDEAAIGRYVHRLAEAANTGDKSVLV